MGTIFVAYGEPEHRTSVLKFAAEQAAACDHELLVYHIQDPTADSAERVREEIESVVQGTAPGITFTVHINTPDDLSRVSKRKRLTDAIIESDREYEYVVMANIERDSPEGFTHSSMTEAVLKTHAAPVMLVPV